MNGFDRLKEEIKDQEDIALRQTVDYLLSRDDMEPKYLNEEKSLEGMCNFIKSRAHKHIRNGWGYVTNEIVYAWAVMYYSLPNQLLKIDSSKSKNATTKSTISKNNVVSLEDAKKKIKEKNEVTQLSLFGGAT